MEIREGHGNYFTGRRDSPISVSDGGDAMSSNFLHQIYRTFNTFVIVSDVTGINIQHHVASKIRALDASGRFGDFP